MELRQARSHCVEHVRGRERKGACHTTQSVGFITDVQLGLHVKTGHAEPRPRLGVEDVVEAAVGGLETSEEHRVVGVDDGVSAQQ